MIGYRLSGKGAEFISDRPSGQQNSPPVVPERLRELVPVVRLQPPVIPTIAADLLAFLNETTTLREHLRGALRQALDRVADETPHLKRYNENSHASWYWEYPWGSRTERLEDSFSAVDLTQVSSATLAYGAYDLCLRLPKGEPVEAQHFTEQARCFIEAPAPWTIQLHFAETRPLKTQFTFRLRYFLGLQLPLLSMDDLPRKDECLHQFRCVGQGNWGLAPIWECRLCGVLAVCSCFKKVCETHPLKMPAEVWYPVRRRIDSVEFIENACHLCRGVPSDFEFQKPMYARSDFERYYRPYITKKALELGIPVEAADNLLREELGFRRIGEGHVRETRLYHLVREALPGHEVMFHAHPAWLGGLELDVYIPSLHLAFEHQGQQHFCPVEAWGGAEAHRALQGRDERKARLCRENGVRLVEIRYDVELTSGLVREHITACGGERRT